MSRARKFMKSNQATSNEQDSCKAMASRQDRIRLKLLTNHIHYLHAFKVGKTILNPVEKSITKEKVKVIII